MKRKYILLATLGLLSFSSCIEDKGSYGGITVNEITVTGQEESYSVMAGTDPLITNVEVKGSVLGEDDSNYEYTWYACSKALASNSHEHTILGNEKNLNTIIELAPGNYDLYLLIKDSTTDQEWIISDMTLNVSTGLANGFYVFGDKEDGTVGMDFLSMPPTEGDTTMIYDLFANSTQLKGAKDLIYTGYIDRAGFPVNLWAVTEDGTYKIENSIQEKSTDFEIDNTYNESYMFPSPMMEHPAKIVDQFPNQLYGGGAYSRTDRGFITEDAVVLGSNITAADIYGNPVNRYDQSSTELFKPFKTVFYTPYSTMIRAFMLYDLDNNRFCTLDGSMFATIKKCRKLTDQAGDRFPFDQSQVKRTIVAGQNMVDQSYALMKDIDNNTNYYIYLMQVSSHLSVTKLFYSAFTTTEATDINKAKLFTFSYDYPVMLYAIDNKLYKFQYDTKQVELVHEYDGEITYLTFDPMSVNEKREPNSGDIIVCTYNNETASEERGTIYKYNMGQDLNLTPIKDSKGNEFIYHTPLKIKKMEYRNSTL